MEETQKGPSSKKAVAKSHDPELRSFKEKKEQMKNRLTRFLDQDTESPDSCRFISGIVSPLAETFADFTAFFEVFRSESSENIRKLLKCCHSDNASLDHLPFKLEETATRGYEVLSDVSAQTVYDKTTILEMATRLLVDKFVTSMPTMSHDSIILLKNEIEKADKLNKLDRQSQSQSRTQEFRNNRLGPLYVVAHSQMRHLATAGKIESLKQVFPVNNAGDNVFFPFQKRALQVCSVWTQQRWN